MSKVVQLELMDGSGGMNSRDPASGLLKNQFRRLKNYLTDQGAYLWKRLGQELIQYTPIDPQPFTSDALTFGLWHLDSGATFAQPDSGPGGRNFTSTGQNGIIGNVPGIFPLAPSTPAGIKVTAAFDQINTVYNGQGLDFASFKPLHNFASVAFDAWINISSDITRPNFVTRSAVRYETGVHLAEGAALVGSAAYNSVFTSGNLVNGLSFHQDYDSTAAKNSSGPYVKFRLNTLGIPGTTTTIQTAGLPAGKWLHIRGGYNGLTGKMRLYVNAQLADTADVNGAGNVDDTDAEYFVAGAGLASVDTVASVGIYSAFPGRLDEIRVSSDDREGEGFPYKKPRGNPMVLEKADGTLQTIVAADTGLYFTVGNKEWTLITNTEPSDPSGGTPLSATADWDGTQIDDRLYLTNGINTPLTWDGSRLVPTGNGAVGLNLSLSASGTTHTNGAFLYVFTYCYDDPNDGGFETGFSPPASITVAGAFDVNIAEIPTRHDNCTKIRIYRTKAGGSIYFLLREIDNDPNVTSIDLSGLWVNNGSPDTDTGADGVPDGAASTNLNDDADYAQVNATVAATTTPKCSYYLAAHGRLNGTGILDRRYDVVWSALRTPDVFQPRAFVVVDGDKGPLNALGLSYGEILIGKNSNATSVLRGTDPSNWTLTEDIHPKVGPRDHWSFVHRYPVNDKGEEYGRYVLCFVGPDAIYKYEGQQISAISDAISPTFNALSVNTSTKLDWIVTEAPQFQGAVINGGAADQNVQTTAYETDGLREVPGEVRIVDQLDYIGLWNAANPLATGKVTCIAKGAAEGEFYFGTDTNAQAIYYTTDNFKTKSQLVAVGGATEYPVALVIATVGGLVSLFAVMSTTASLGSIWRIIDPVGAGGVGPTVGQLTSGLNFKVSKGTSSSFPAVDGLVAFGGTFSAQPIWDGTNSFLWFVASDLDGNGVYRPRAKTVTLAGVVANRIPTFQVSSDLGYVAIAASPTSMFIAFFDTTTSKAMLASALLSAPGTITDISPFNPSTNNSNMFVRRLSFNTQSGRLVAIGQKNSPAAAVNAGTKFISFFDTSSGVLTELKSFPVSSSSTATPLEITYQTSTPYAHFVAMNAIDATEATAIYKVAKESAAASDVTAHKTAAYEGNDASAAVNGIISNLLFVAASGADGSFLWADRLYWFGNAAVAANARMIQLGVPGTWTVKGGLTIDPKNLGSFSAFGNFATEYSGNIEFFFRNAATIAALAASELQATPNQPIGGFNPVTAYAQWRVYLTWDYSVAVPTSSPYVRVVDIGYFLGDNTAPRPIAYHWRGRTYFFLATSGEEANNLVAVYDKKNAWTIYEDWQIGGVAKFRGDFIAIQGYQLVKLESGFTDLGRIIKGLARTGSIAGYEVIAIEDMEASIEGSQNPDFPTKNGYVVVTPYAGEDAKSPRWALALAQTAVRELLRVHGEVMDEWGWGWGQSFGIEIKTSEETSGTYAPYPSQQEIIQKIDLTLLASPVGREYDGK